MSPFVAEDIVDMGEPGEHYSEPNPHVEGDTWNYLRYPENTPDRFIVRLSGTYFMSFGKDGKLLANPISELSFPYTFDWDEDHDIAKIFT